MMRHKRFCFKAASVSEDGSFEGYASVFNIKDQGGDIILPGAFTKTLAEWKADGNPIPILWNHDYKDVRGAWAHFEERENGLWGRGQLNMDTAGGREARALMQQPAINGLSIGYELPSGSYEYDEAKDAFIISEVKLWEVSVVTWPMNQESRIETVKSLLARGEMPSVRIFEKALRDLGLSKRNATDLASHAKSRGMLGEDDGPHRDGADLGALLEPLSALKSAVAGDEKSK